MDYVFYVEKAMQGDLESYEYLVEHFQSMTVNYAYSILGDFGLAEDASQEAFILLFRHIHEVQNPQAFVPWLRRLVFTCCSRMTRRKSREILTGDETVSAGEPLLGGGDPGEKAEQKELTALVKQAMDKLTPAQQEVFVLYHMLDKSYQEIADMLHVTVPAVANRLHACKKKLKTILLSDFSAFKEYIGGYMMNSQFTRKVIDNIRALYAIPSENYMFDAAMSSAMVHLNGDETMDFLFFAGVTGDIFSQVWIEPKWQYHDAYSDVGKYTQNPIRRAFDACGYTYEFVDKATLQRDKDKYIRKIVESIDKGHPVLTFGIVGPPICSIICGYDRQGEVLIGWSQFTDEPGEGPTDAVQSNGQFRKENGLDCSQALVFIGSQKKDNIPSKADSMRQSLLHIPACAFREALPLEEGRVAYFGGEAFRRWADSLSHEELFADEDSLPYPADTYGSCMVMVGTNMFYMNAYLDRALSLCPDMEDTIRRLKEAYDKENEALQRLAGFQGGYFLEDHKVLQDKNFRTTLAAHILEVGKCYEEAARIMDGKC